MGSRIIVVQPECKDRTGHHYAAIRSLEHAIAPAKPIFCIHRGASETLELAKDRTIRHFAGRISGLVGTPSDEALSASSGVRSLGDLFDRLAIGPNDHLVFLSTSAETVLAILHLLQPRNPEMLPHCHLRFLGDERRQDLENTAHRLLNDFGCRTPRLHLYTEYAACVREVLKHYHSNPFELSRLPTLWPDEINSEDDSGCDLWFTVGVLGQPRRDKGKYRLGPIFAEFFKQRRKANIQYPLKVLIQNDRRLHRALRLRASLAAKVRMEIGRVHFAAADMSSQAFVSTMRQCDVILLPYIPDTYQKRGSGIVIDAVAHGIPLVCTTGTAMCELIDCGNGLTASNNEEFVHCLMTVAAGGDRFRLAARDAARRAHDWQSDSLLGALRNV